MRTILINTDGGARGNPGPAAIGVVIADESGAVLKELSVYIGEATNNVAEYEALIRALLALRELVEDTSLVQVRVRMDSELIVRQIEGVYRVKEPTLRGLFARVSQLREVFPYMSFEHVRREQNKRADELVNEALDARI